MKNRAQKMQNLRSFIQDGWYPIEEGGNSVWVWCQEKSTLRIPEKTQHLELHFATIYPELKKATQNIKISLNGKFYKEYQVKDKHSVIKIDCANAESAALEVDVVRPSDFDASQDSRLLGICLVQVVCISSDPYLESGRNTLKEHQRIALERFLSLVSVKGKVVLEIGTDYGCETLHALRDYNPEWLIGINYDQHYSNRIDIAGNCYFQKLDARNTGFASNFFDTVFSISTFEHINELDRAVSEINRILRPGGELYAHFGPIWSCYLGHHVHTSLDGEVASFEIPERNPFPPHAHLYLSEHEVMELLKKHYSPKMVEAILYQVYQGTGINRLFFEDYVHILESSGLEIILFNEFWKHPVDEKAKKELKRFGSHRNFETCGIEILCKKSKLYR